MTHVTALLIVLTLTGTPVANAACIAWWCERVPEAMKAGCHEHVAVPMSAAISGGSGTCAALQADIPFLPEEGRVAVHAPSILGVLHASDVTLPGGNQLTWSRSVRETTTHGPTAALVLRL